MPGTITFNSATTSVSISITSSACGTFIYSNGSVAPFSSTLPIAPSNNLFSTKIVEKIPDNITLTFDTFTYLTQSYTPAVITLDKSTTTDTITTVLTGTAGGSITLIVIYIYFSNDITHSNKDIKINKINNYTSDKSKETYKRSIKDVSKPESKKISYKYVKPSDNNPFMNRLPFEKKTNLDKITILKKNTNSFKNTQNKINDKFTDGLYKDITDIYGNENSQRQFYTVSNTDIVSEQGKFAEWLYSN